jgi:phospholipase/carboxylesterase
MGRLTAALAVAGAMLVAACSGTPERHGPQLLARPSGSPAEAAATDVPRQLNLGSRRDGWVYVPAAALDGPAPLLVFLHGSHDSGRVIEALVAMADREGVIVLAPDSRGTTWGGVGGDESADLAFLDRALAQVFERYRIDARRIAIAGFADGATAALSWGLANGDLFCGIAAFSAGLLRSAGPPQGRPRILMIHGLRDPVFPVAATGRRIAGLLEQAGYAVELREFDGGHVLPPAAGSVAREILAPRP